MKIKLVAVSAIVGLGLSLHAAAAELEALDKWSVGLGGFAVTLDADMRVDGTTTSGRPVDLGRDLGTDDERSVLLVSVGWRPWEHHQFDFTWYQDSNTNTRVSDREFVIGDETFEPGATLRSTFAFDSYDLTYTWWLQATPRQAFGVHLGLIDYAISLDVLGSVDGNNQTFERSASASADLPSPKLGVSYRRVFGDKWRLLLDASAFTAHIGDIDADVYDLRAGMEYMFLGNWGLRAQYSLNRIKADTDQSDFDGRVELQFSGAQVQVVGRF